jgi:hypothetical protein
MFLDGFFTLLIGSRPDSGFSSVHNLQFGYLALGIQINNHTETSIKPPIPQLTSRFNKNYIILRHAEIFTEKNWIDIWFIEKLGTDCITFYETVNSLLKTIGTSLGKKSQQTGTGHSLIQNFLFKKTGKEKLVTKSKNHTTLV